MSIKHRMGVWKLRPFMDDDGEIRWHALRCRWLITWWYLQDQFQMATMDNREVFGSVEMAKSSIEHRIWRQARALLPAVRARHKLRRWRQAGRSLPDIVRFP